MKEIVINELLSDDLLIASNILKVLLTIGILVAIIMIIRSKRNILSKIIDIILIAIYIVIEIQIMNYWKYSTMYAVMGIVLWIAPLGLIKAFLVICKKQKNRESTHKKIIIIEIITQIVIAMMLILFIVYSVYINYNKYVYNTSEITLEYYKQRTSIWDLGVIELPELVNNGLLSYLNTSSKIPGDDSVSKTIIIGRNNKIYKVSNGYDYILLPDFLKYDYDLDCICELDEEQINELIQELDDNSYEEEDFSFESGRTYYYVKIGEQGKMRISYNDLKNILETINLDIDDVF